ncbi:MAG: methylenetetrahydrofolate reductase [NAD(P)H] [Gammaproteobacteria bacterium]
MKNQDFNISFEFYPPKTPIGMEHLNEAAIVLEKLTPAFFSVTFGAGGSTREGTLQTVKMIQANTNTAVAPHLACVGCTRSELIQIIQGYQTLGLRRIVALRGDLPSGMGQSGELKYASELVSLIREITGDHFHIEVAAYPEFHPQSKSAADDIMNFKIKMDAGANSAITQYFFNPDAYFYFIDACAKVGIFNPIIPGIMPITQFAKLVRFSDMCGAEIPRWIRKRLESYGDDVESIKSFGIEVIHSLCVSLLKGGAPGLHFYTLNHPEASLEIVPLLKETLAAKKKHPVVNV